MFRAIVVCEGEFEHLVEYETQEEMNAFEEGLFTGTRIYGSIKGCGIYTLEDLDGLDMGYNRDRNLVELINQYLGNKGDLDVPQSPRDNTCS